VYSHLRTKLRAHQLRGSRQVIALLLIVGITLVAGREAPPASAQATPCQLVPVLAMLRDAVGRDRVGDCTGPAIRADNDDVTQPTTRGTLMLRAADLVALFNDGQTTWLYGPRGLESRPSASRLPWEAPAGSAAASPTDPSAVIRSPGPVAAASPAPLSSPITDQPVKVDGSTSQTSAPFDLAGGEYNVTWQARMQNGNASCYVGSWLRRADDPNPGNLLLHTNLNNTKDRSAAGETRLFNVAPGRYVLDVMTTGCDWSFELTPRR